MAFYRNPRKGTQAGHGGGSRSLAADEAAYPAYPWTMCRFWRSSRERIRPRHCHNYARSSRLQIIHQSPDEIREAIVTRVAESADPFLTGVCCVNMDDRVPDEKVRTIFETVSDLRQRKVR